MQISVESQEPSQAQVDVLAVPLAQPETSGSGAKARLPGRIAALDARIGGRIAEALASGDFKAKRGDTLTLYGSANGAARRIVLVGLGRESEVDGEALRRAAGAAVGAAQARGAKSVGFVAPALRRLRPPALAQALAEGAVLGAYRFDTYRGKKDDGRAAVSRFLILAERAGDVRAARDGARTGVILAESQNLARDLSNEPANHLPPIALAQAAERMAKEVGLGCRVLDVTEMRKRKMGALLAVGQGSENPPRLVVLEHNAPARGARGGKARAGRRLPTVCLVGKGITFDSGGISIKPGAGMHEMKHDMSGGAAVIGALRAAALLSLPLHLVGIVAAAENLPSGSAYRPGDVLTASNGTTIEVLNTDAEGRLVLADALHFARTEFEPAALVDLATLTGACVVALGKWCAGAMGNRERLVERLRRAGEATSERVWPLPLWEEHREHIRGDVADIKNTGGRDAGTLTAGAFLSHFVGETPWVHLDIAGTAYTDRVGPYQAKGATGFGVRLLIEALRGWSGAAIV